MKFARFSIAFVLLLLAASVAAKQDKVLVCHVGNEVGPYGETYLDDPDCVPGDLNDYSCPDAGKIDLIVVAAKAADNHLDNPSHFWDGISDYDPIAMGATGDGTEDSDGNGVDDGCEIPDECPCWDEIDLLAVTADNQYFVSCDSYNWAYPDGAGLQGITEPYPSTFFAWNSDAQTIDGSPRGPAQCSGHFADGTFEEGHDIPDEQANACISQIYQRCADLGRPVGPD